MSNNKVLFIVEGDSDEVQFLRNMFSKCFTQQNYDIYSYKTNIHILAQVLFNEYLTLSQMKLTLNWFSVR